jgi:hypothetical protein
VLLDCCGATAMIGMTVLYLRCFRRGPAVF